MRKPGSRVVSWSLALAVLALGGVAFSEHIDLTDVRQQRDHLAKQLDNSNYRQGQLLAERAYYADEQSPQNLAAKKDCAATALRMFHALGYNEHVQQNDTGMPRTEDYSSHYNRRLGRCLLAYDDENFSKDKSGSHEVSAKGIIDADERRQIGDYLWMSSETKKYWEQKPIQCHETVPGKPEAWCHSTSEWDDFENDLMNS